MKDTRGASRQFSKRANNGFHWSELQDRQAARFVTEHEKKERRKPALLEKSRTSNVRAERNEGRPTPYLSARSSERPRR